jgi:hypothetical protein
MIVSKRPEPVTIPEGFKITKLADGEAIGARDLQNWGKQRAIGSSGVRDNRKNILTFTIRCKCGYKLEFLVRKSQLSRIGFKCAKCGEPINPKGRRRDRDRCEPPILLLRAEDDPCGWTQEDFARWGEPWPAQPGWRQRLAAFSWNEPPWEDEEMSL